MIVIVSDPVAAFLFALMVIVELPEPVIVVGLNDTLTPLPAPEADRLMLELNPPLATVVMVSETELLCVTDSEVEAALRVKSPVVAAVTVRFTVVVCVNEPLVPVMVMG